MAQGTDGPTVLYLIRHGATEASLARPERLIGQKMDLPLAPLGIRQARATRDLLAIRPIDHCYTSPLWRARETAAIVSSSHGLTPRILEALTECDMGTWENQDWETIRKKDPDAYERFHANPGQHGFPGGENFANIHARVFPALNDLMNWHSGRAILVVSHHIVHRVYLATLLGLTPDEARKVSLDNCGISVVIRNEGHTALTTLNATFHLQGVAA